MYFGHECSKEDQRVMQHLDKVQNVFATTTMLHTIEAAHIPYTDNQEDTNSVSINSSFFLHAGGQNTQDLTPIEQDVEPSDHTDHSDSQTESEGYGSPTQTENSNSHSEDESSFNHRDDEAESTSSSPPPGYGDSECESDTQS